MQLQPLADRVIVQPLKEEEKTPGGIYLPDTAKEKPQQGKVVAVGPGRVNDKGQKIEMTVKVGDRVVYSKYAGTEVEVGGEEYLILSEADILAIVQE
ncbi:MAG: co-chaperone GroES [Bacillota bacterium]|nr:co-chaperone GroES [Bacillota bacterium]REJ36804.1 MAG: co-chaperone GroES [Bacillota bacterium]